MNEVLHLPANRWVTKSTLGVPDGDVEYDLENSTIWNITKSVPCVYDPEILTWQEGIDIYIYIDMTGVKSPWSKKLPVTQSWNVCPLQPADFPKNPCDRVAEVTMGRTGLKRKEVGRLPCDLPCGSLDCRPALSQDPNHSLAKHGKTRSATCFLTDSSQQYTGWGPQSIAFSWFISGWIQWFMVI